MTDRPFSAPNGGRYEVGPVRPPDGGVVMLRRVYRSWLQVTTLGLISVLLLVTPGGSTCLPVGHGRHVHITWSDPMGHDLPGPAVFTHQTAEVPLPHSGSHALSAVSLTAWPILEMAFPNEAPLVTPAVWLNLNPTLVLVRAAELTAPGEHQFGPDPLVPPPRPS